MNIHILRNKIYHIKDARSFLVTLTFGPKLLKCKLLTKGYSHSILKQKHF